MSLTSFLDVVVMNALLHARIQHVGVYLVWWGVFASAFPPVKDQHPDIYNTTAEVVPLSVAYERVSQTLKSRSRIAALQTSVKHKKDLKNGPVVILVCNGIKQMTKGKHNAFDNLVLWTSTCSWLS